jgi:hypothetical protein
MNNTEEMDKLKKKIDAAGEKSSNVNFIIKTAQSILKISIYFALSGLILYACKVNKLIVLPTDIDVEPFTKQPSDTGGMFDTIRNAATTSKPTANEKMFIPSQKTADFDTNIFGDEQNIRFNVENPPYKILDYFANYKNNPQANFFVTFILKQVEALFSLNYTMYTTLLGFMDETFNENLIVLIGPLLMMYYSILILLVDFIYIIYGWFANLHWLFKRNNNTSKKGLPDWYTSIFSLNGFLSWNLMIVLNILLFFALPFIFTMPVLQIAIMLITFFSIVSFKGVINNTPVNGFTFVYTQFIKNYKRLISSVLTLSILSNSFNILGTYHGVFGVLFVLFMYFVTDLYKPYNFSSETSANSRSENEASAPPFAESKLDVPSAPPLAAVNEPSKNASIDEELTYTENPLSTRKNLPVATPINGGGGLMKKLRTINKKYNLK